MRFRKKSGFFEKIMSVMIFQKKNHDFRKNHDFHDFSKKT